MCFGHECELWHDTIDESSFDTFGNERMFVMTTWHTDETPEDVAEFFSLWTHFDEWNPDHYLLATIGKDMEIESRLLSEITKHQILV